MDIDRLFIDSTEYETEVPRNSVKQYAGLPDGRDVKAFIPGTVVEIRTREGDRIASGQVLLLLDAMKMHNEVCSSVGGRVSQLLVAEGDRVEKNQILVRIET